MSARPLRRHAARIQAAALLVAVALIPVAGPAVAAPAVTDSTPGLSTASLVLPPGAKTPTLTDLQDATTRKGLERAAQVAQESQTARETTGPAAKSAAVAATPSAVAPLSPARRSMAAMTVQYPEPARTMTMGECKNQLGGDTQFYLKSRFAVCSGKQVTVIWKRKDANTPVGESTFKLYVVGTVPQEADRTIHFDYYFTDFSKAGTTETDGQIHLLNGQLPQTWPSSAQPVFGGNLPTTYKSWDELSQGGGATFQHTVRFAPGQGTGAGAADTVFAAYQPVLTSLLPKGWDNGKGGQDLPDVKPFMMAPRWDSASYLRNSTGSGNPANKGGAAFSYLATLNYSAQAGAPEQAVAQHIQLAFTNPTATKPLNALKKIPGNSADRPLHRLYLDSKRRDRNRAVAVRECTRYWGPNYTDGGKECDEFPFATTYEGSALEEYDVHAEKLNYSAMPLDGTQNGAAGNLLSGFYTSNRIIDGPEDGFTVSIAGSAPERRGLLTNQNSNRCLEIDGSSTANGALAQQWDCNGQPGAVWVTRPTSDGAYVNLVNDRSGKCLEVADSRKDNGAPVQQWDCAGVSTQEWELQGTPSSRILKNVNSGKILEIDNSSTANGARVQQWDNVGQPSAKWREG
ncbi:RICIN domain-containing protein [Streptomyces sp. NPDC056682]|uniref:RICIN domain-containing protein n=1 Tax=Streptomyces sp. NPDC056682 TaxID=3345909 RepID=UPI0036C20A36